jgi:pimeloyl-[acyl-carrier protein] methyl ester esterase
VWDRLQVDNAVKPSFASVATVDGFFSASEAAMPREPVVIMGWSMGGMLALELALANPEQVTGLILIGTSPTFVSSDRTKGWPERAVTRMKRTLTKDADVTLAQFQQAMFAESEAESADEFHEARSHTGAMDFSPPGLSAGLDYLIGFDQSANLSDLACPVLWIHGAEDSICPVGCLDAVPSDHQKLIIPKAGHAPQWSRPEIVQDAVREFINAC